MKRRWLEWRPSGPTSLWVTIIGVSGIWSARRRLISLSNRRTWIWFQARSQSSEKREDFKYSWRVARKGTRYAIDTLFLLVASQGIGELLRSHGNDWAHRLTMQPSPSIYFTLLSSSVGALAVFLALFYTTVGVVASTSYQRVPSGVRQLFVEERGNTLFTRSTLRALLFGIGILLLPALGFRASTLSLSIDVLLTIFSVLSLVVVGLRLFNFFDLSSLSVPLEGRLGRFARQASASRSVPSEVRARIAHLGAAQTLERYRQILTLLRGHEGLEARIPLEVARQLLQFEIKYSSMKASIPTESAWFRREISHRNWLTLDSMHLDIALDTRTSVQPETFPEKNWIEKEIAELLHLLLPLILNQNNWRQEVQLSGDVLTVVSRLGFLGQVDEALVIREVLLKVFRSTRAPVTSSTAIETNSLLVFDSGDTEIAHFESGRQVVDSLTVIWLGLARLAQQIDIEASRQEWHSAVTTKKGPYRIGAVSQVLSELEVIADGIQFELKSQRAKVTPDWWIDHFLARALSATLIESFQTLVDKLQTEVTGMVEEAIESNEHFLAAGMILSVLELVRKIQAMRPSLELIISRLGELRSDAIDDDDWPELP